MRTTAQSGIAQILLLLILLLGLGVGIYLVQNTQIFKSEAGYAVIILKDKDGNKLPGRNNIFKGSSAEIKVELHPESDPVLNSGPLKPTTPAALEVKIAAWGRSDKNIKPAIALFDGEKLLKQFTISSTDINKPNILSFKLPPGQKFTNKPSIRFSNPGDKNRVVYIDYLQVGETKYQTEDLKTTHTLRRQIFGKTCPKSGNIHSEELLCDGEFRYDQYTPQPIGEPISAPISPIPSQIYFKIAESPAEFTSLEKKLFSGQDIDFQFKNKNLGRKTVWVMFFKEDGKNSKQVTRAAYLDLVAPTPTPNSTPIPTVTPTPTPSPSPIPVSSRYKRVFLSSTQYNGNLGGLSGADAKCLERANAANLGGTWKAWISTTNTSAASRLSHSSLPYKLLNGTTVANNWADLTDGTIQNAIGVNELGQNFFPSVWTNTQANGNSKGVLGCGDWVSSASTGTNNALGQFGAPGFNDGRWTDYTFLTCDQTAALYCFEQ